MLRRSSRAFGNRLVALGRRFQALGTDHRAVVGGLWESMGRLQLEFLERQGLEPEHRLLDVGCGSLRAGVHFVRYLEPGHYFGLDISDSMIERGRAELAAAGLSGRGPRLLVDDSFSFELLGSDFDFAIAQSVFTHLPLNSIHRCLVNIAGVLRPGGRFYATIFEQEREPNDLRPQRWATDDGLTLETWPDRDPYHYRPEALLELCRELPLQFEYIGEWGHPRRQRMLQFTRSADAG